jgi:hypothetical protein
MEENRMKSEWSADPLVWGHGPTVFEMFLEPTCPFSVKAFGKLDDLLGQAGEDRITVKLSHHRQAAPSFAAVAHVLGRDRTLYPGRLHPRKRQGSSEICHGGDSRAS